MGGIGRDWNHHGCESPGRIQYVEGGDVCDQKVLDACDCGGGESSALPKGSVCALYFDLTDRAVPTNASSSNMPMHNVK